MTDDFKLEAPTPKKKVVKPQYTEAFNKFWTAYPRKTAKFKAFQSWQSHVDETDRDQVRFIITDLEKRTRLRFWAADQSKIPMATTFINQHRWDDEWEPEVKTRGRETMATYTKPVEKPIEDEYDVGSWMRVCNRLLRNYLLKAGGFTESMLKQVVKIKNDTHKELLPAINEEIAAADDKQRARGEMAYMLAETLLSRVDMITGKALKPAIIDMSKRFR